MQTRVVIGFVDSDQCTGTFVKNPFNFGHYKITTVIFHIPKQCTFFDSFASHPSSFKLTRYLKLSSNNNYRYN